LRGVMPHIVFIRQALRPKGFEGVAVILLTRGFTSEQTIAVLCSKEMRWAADVCALSTEEYNYIPAARFTEYEDKSRGGRGRARPMTAREATTLMFPDQPKLAA